MNDKHMKTEMNKENQAVKNININQKIYDKGQKDIENK